MRIDQHLMKMNSFASLLQSNSKIIANEIQNRSGNKNKKKTAGTARSINKIHWSASSLFCSQLNIFLLSSPREQSQRLQHLVSKPIQFQLNWCTNNIAVDLFIEIQKIFFQFQKIDFPMIFLKWILFSVASLIKDFSGLDLCFWTHLFSQTHQRSSGNYPKVVLLFTDCSTWLWQALAYASSLVITLQHLPTR